MDIEARVREAVRADERSEPSPQFHGRVMSEVLDRPRRTVPLFGVLSFPPRLAAIALVGIIATCALGLPFVLSRSTTSASSSPTATATVLSPQASAGASATDPATASPTAAPSVAWPRGVPTILPVVSHAPSAQFTPTGSAQYMFENVTPLADGRVLLAGGVDDVTGRFLADAALYDPSTGKFTPTGSLSAPRASATATRLLDGRVLIVGGSNDSHQQVGAAEIYDPATGRFTTTGSLTSPRQYHTATLLQDGRVLVTGGYADNPVASRGATHAVEMAYRPGASLGTQGNGMTLEKGVLRSAEIYDPNTGSFTSTGSMTEARFSASAALLNDGRVLIVGTATMDVPTDKTAELFDPKTGKFTRTGSMNVARTNQNLTVLKDGRVLITDGALDWKSTETYDPKTGKFTLTGSLAVPAGGFPAVLLADGRVLIPGGVLQVGGNVTQTVQTYDPKTGTCSVTGYMTTARATAAAVGLLDGRVLIFGGGYPGPGGWTNLRSAEIYTP